MNDTYDVNTEENNFYDSIIIAKTVLNVTLEFLRYRIERKVGAILRRKLATHNEKCQTCHVSVRSKFSQLCFLENYHKK